MIPIECPNCGRGGIVPLDRLNARMVCKGCHATFHMDPGGRTVLGDPGDGGKKPKQMKSAKSAEVDLGQVWKDVPKPVKLAVPGFVLAFLLWQFNPFGGGGPDYQGRAEALIRAVVANDRAKALSFATSETAGPAGKWYDLIRGQVDQKKVAAGSSISVAVFSGNPESDTTLTLWCVVTDPAIGAESTVPVNIVVTRDGGTWKLDGAKSLTEGEKSIAPSPGAKKG